MSQLSHSDILENVYGEDLPVDDIDDVLAHHGVKGMKWGVRKKTNKVSSASTPQRQDLKKEEKEPESSSKDGGGGGGGGGSSSKDNKDEEVSPIEGETVEEFNERQKMIDEFLKNRDKKEGKGGGKAGGGGGKGGGAKKKSGSKGAAKKGSSDDSSATRERATSIGQIASKSSTSYPARRAISSILGTKTISSIPENPRAKALIDQINANVEARLKPKTETKEDETVQHSELAHYGVLGMKWGVRKDHRGVVGRTDMHPGGLGTQGFFEVYEKNDPNSKAPHPLNAAAEREIVARATMAVRKALVDKRSGPLNIKNKNSPVLKLNNEYRNKDLSDSVVFNEYLTKVENVLNEAAQKATLKNMYSRVVTHPDGDVDLLVGDKEFVIEFEEALRHGDFNGTQTKLRLIQDASKLVIGIELAEPDVAPVVTTITHSEIQELVSNETFSEEDLAHYGVLGMKWGVRKDAQNPAAGFGGGGGGGWDDEDEDLTPDELQKKIEEAKRQLKELWDKLWETEGDRDEREARERVIREEIKELEAKKKAAERKEKKLKERIEELKKEKIDQDDLEFWKDRRRKNREAKEARERALEKGRDRLEFEHNDEEGMNSMSDEIEHSQAIGKAFLGELFNGTEELSEDELAHYGVLGMKWGIRKDRGGGGRLQGGPNRDRAPKADIKKAQPITNNQTVNDETVASTTKRFKDTDTGKVYELTYDTNKLTINDDGSWEAKDKETADAFRRLMAGQGIKDRGTTDLSIKPVEKPKADGRMSDEDLRNAINRMQMEKTYKQLLAEQNAVPPKQQNVVKKIISDSVKMGTSQLLTNAFKIVGTYAVAAAIAKTNPALANALMKGVGDAAKAKTEEPDASVASPKEQVQQKVKQATQSAKKTQQVSSNTPRVSDAGKQKIANEMAANPRTNQSSTSATTTRRPSSGGLSAWVSGQSSSSRTSSLDLGSTPQQNVNPQAVTDAYNRAYGNVSPATQQILDDLERYRNS